MLLGHFSTVIVGVGCDPVSESLRPFTVSEGSIVSSGTTFARLRPSIRMTRLSIYGVDTSKPLLPWRSLRPTSTESVSLSRIFPTMSYPSCPLLLVVLSRSERESPLV